LNTTAICDLVSSSTSSAHQTEIIEETTILAAASSEVSSDTCVPEGGGCIPRSSNVEDKENVSPVAPARTEVKIPHKSTALTEATDAPNLTCQIETLNSRIENLEHRLSHLTSNRLYSCQTHDTENLHLYCPRCEKLSCILCLLALHMQCRVIDMKEAESTAMGASEGPYAWFIGGANRKDILCPVTSPELAKIKTQFKLPLEAALFVKTREKESKWEELVEGKLGGSGRIPVYEVMTSTLL